MFCSLPTTAKSSKWLHRLRASRGFQESDVIDLEHFLSASRDPADSVLAHKKPLPEPIKHDDNGGVQERDLINNVLSELFHMGEFDGLKKKKSCRKQQCPRICVVSTDMDVTARKKPLISSSRVKVKGVEEKGHYDLSEYSQTEVTVIDTSVPCWKFERMLYRNKNVWKVADKKGKGLMSVDRKKSKERVNDYVHKKKFKKKLKLCTSPKYVVVDKEEKTMVDQGNDRGKMVAAANEKKWGNSCSQVQEKSLCKKQIDEGSSVILIKSIPTTNKKNLSGVSNGCVQR